MSKKILSFLLVLSMILTTLPIQAMAQEEYTSIDPRGEIIEFEPLGETEKAVIVGTSIDDLELPTTLRAKVCTYTDMGTDNVYGSEEETTVDIPVTWSSQPEYDRDTKGEYIFTPIIDGYVLAELVEVPQIIVTVEATMLREMYSDKDPSPYNIRVAGVPVTDDNKNNIIAPGLTKGKVTYDAVTNTLTLTDVNITFEGNVIDTFTQSLIIVLEGTNIVTSTSSNDDNAFCTRGWGSFTFKGDGSLEARGIYSGIYAFDDLIIESGTIIATGQKVGISTNRGSITISGGNVIAEATTEGTRTCEGYGIAQDWDGTLDLTVSGYANVTAKGIRGAIGPNKLNMSEAHRVMAGYDEINAKVVTSLDESTWGKPYVQLFLGYAISGTITDKEDTPIEGATVQIQKEGVNFGVPVTTSAYGTYTTQVVPNGNYTIKVSKIGYENAVVSNINVSGSPTSGILTVLKALYNVTVKDGIGSGNYAEGAIVTISANDKIGYTFTGWSSEDVTFTNATSKIKTFVMPSKSVAITANYRLNTSGGSGSGSDNDGKSSDSNTVIIIVTPPAPDKPDSPTQAEIKVPIAADRNNNVTVDMTSQMVNKAYEKALSKAEKISKEENGITLVLNVDTGSTRANTVTVNLPKAVQDAIIEKKIVNTIIVVDNPDIQISMDLATVEEINSQANSDVNITAIRKDSSKLSEDAKEAIGNRPVFDFSINYGSNRQVQNFGDGSVTVEIPYTLGKNEKAENIYAVYIDDNGIVHWLNDSVYDVENKVLRFRTNHFSIYGVGYKEDLVIEIPAFTDIINHWAKEDIEYVVRQGLFSGTSETGFSPNMAMTRGMFVTVLGRMAEADVS